MSIKLCARGGGPTTGEFPASGSIQRASFPHLVVQLYRQGATGSLVATGPVCAKALYFRAGRISFASSKDPRDQLGAILVESGRISREHLDEVNEKAGPGNPLVKVLEESRFVTRRELRDAASVKVERILSDLLSWETGSFQFENRVLPKEAPDLELSTGRLFLAAVGRSEPLFALRHVESETVLEPDPEGGEVLREVWAGVFPVFEHLDGRRSLKEAISLSRLDELEATRIACAMLLLGVVRRTDAIGGSAIEGVRRSCREWLEGGAVMDRPNLTELEGLIRVAEEHLRAAKELREEEHAELMVYRQYAEGLAPTLAEHAAIVKALRVICASARWGTVRSWYAVMDPEERKAYDVLEMAARRREES